MSLKPVLIEDVWTALECGLHSVYKREKMKPEKYMDLYTKVFNFCTSTSAVPQPTHTTMKKNSKTPSNADFVGLELYTKLMKFVENVITAVCEGGKELVGEDLLRYYTKEWEEFRFSSKVIDGIFAYLNRHWIKREIDEGNETIFLVYTLALVSWKNGAFKAMKERVTEAVLELIRREREGESVARNLISGVVNSYVELGIDSDQGNMPSPKRDQPASEPQNLATYRQYFEERFLVTTGEFYATEAIKFLEKHHLTEYMQRVETRLKEEQERCDLYLHQSTQAKLARTCEKMLIEEKLPLFQAEFGSLLVGRRDEDLGRMYKLCERVENGLDNLRSALEKHITKDGLTAMETVVDSAFSDPRLYVITILGVHQRYSFLVEQAFRNEPGFMQSLDKAATAFINRNAVTMKNGSHGNKSPELLARYCDGLLRKSSKMPEDLETEKMLNDVMIVFKYIEDKDVFSKFYSKMFSKRLINDQSHSEEAETSLINKLRQMCGHEYTNRMGKMVCDVQLSKEFCSQFRADQEAKGMRDIDFSILVLSTGSWPSMPPMQLQLPNKLSQCMQNFTKFYDSKHNGRKLTWMHSQSKGELSCTAFEKKKYFFTATTAQMAVLMLYNDSTEYSLEFVGTHLQLENKTLCGVMQSLVKNDVLKTSSASTDTEKTGDYLPTTVFTLNMNYSNKKIKVDLARMAMRTDPKKESDAVQKTVEDDRKGVIQAAIVRIMKTRKTLPHSQLIQEIIQQLSSRFTPNVPMIKVCISAMIEKEYIKRSEGQRDIYEYLA